MDTIQQQESQADLFKTSTRIYMHCCDVTNLFTLTVPSFPFLIFEALFAHFSFFRFSVRKANVYFASQRATSASRLLLMCDRVLFSRYVFISLHCVFLSRFSSTTLLFSFAIFTTCTCSQNYRTLGLLLSIIVEFLFLFLSLL